VSRRATCPPRAAKSPNAPDATNSSADPRFVSPYEVSVNILAVRSYPAFRQAVIVAQLLPPDLMGDFRLPQVSIFRAAFWGLVVVTAWGVFRPRRLRKPLRLTDPDGVYGMPAAAIDSILVSDTGRLAERLAGWDELGAERVVLILAGDDWYRQADLVAEAALAGANA